MMQNAILKVVSKGKFHIKERKINLAMIRNLITLEHPRIEYLKYFFMSHNHLFFVTTIPSKIGTNIIDRFLLKKDETPKISHVASVIKEVILGLQYAHSKGISHLELSHLNVVTCNNQSKP